ncbi:glycoside hydrolase family 16 protein [Trematosphaeria pertusa]|uniref:Glycoside hydrolase family 16 protein n=1 Tax=Trematosphaeria pertusa TaxID=390896 RepID=A0A6A6HWF7_9PLEO|nr:glycoside hydrolase family 16 protein [Trematosphaeria pertusa]KAF2242098.1 glycoside hydrolase family 16 protein [Trematosphaeria pertusa]
MRPTSLVSAVLATVPMLFDAGAAHYTLTDDLSYKNFFNAFDFYSGPDPTNGFVQYQDLQSAIKSQYIGYLEDTQSVYLGVDFQSQDANGRASVRAESNKTFNQGLLIADIHHMPASTCGSWPAFWMLGVGSDGQSQWPNAGEVDILEGVNDYDANAVTLHTSAGCAVDNATTPAMGQADAQSAFMGTMETSNCDVAAPDQDKNVGCSIKAPPATAGGGLPTYGTDFNSAGGGVYAMEWTAQSISVWFFPRNSSTYASTFSSSSSNSTNATQTLDPSTFGTPLAKFQGSGCDFTQRFDSMKIIFNTAFCGDWAGEIWDQSCKATTGAATCEEYVQNNPEAFEQSYWEIAALKWYTDADAEGSPAAKKREVGRLPVNPRQRGRRYKW